MEPQQLGQGVPHLKARHHRVHKAVLLLELRPLEALRQGLADGLLDDPGTAKPIRAPGSARMISPREAKLAVTPPVVGSVKTEIYKSPFSEKRASAALVLAICIRERMPSCIRAPPLAANRIRGRRFLVAYSMARVIFSPTAALMEPMKKRLSSTPTTHLRPPMVPVAVTTASVRPVLRWAASTLAR